MKLRLFTTLVALSIIMVSGGLLYAGSTVIQVTDNAHEDTLPQIKGDYVVWQGKVDGDWEVFICNIHTPESPTQITNNDYDDVSPQTDGNYVVWLGNSRSGGEIFLYDIVNRTTTQITDDDCVDSPPQMADGRVIWASQEVTDTVEPGEIFLYHVTTGATEQLTNDTLDDSDPRISAEMALWIQTDENDDSILFVYEIATGISSEAPEDFVWEDNPQTDGDLMVLTRHDGQDGEIFLRNSASGKYHQVSDNELQDTYPSISGNHVAWMAGGEIFLAEYRYLGLISPTDNATLSETQLPTFAWEAIGYGQFKVQFSADPDFPISETFTLPFNQQSWLSELQFSPTEADWKTIVWIAQMNGRVYWRVEGKDVDGQVSFSEAQSFTIYGSGGTIKAATGQDTGTDTTNSGSSCFIDTILSCN